MYEQCQCKNGYMHFGQNTFDRQTFGQNTKNKKRRVDQWGCQSVGRLITSPTNIRLGWK